MLLILGPRRRLGADEEGDLDKRPLLLRRRLPESGPSWRERKEKKRKAARLPERPSILNFSSRCKNTPGVTCSVTWWTVCSTQLTSWSHPQEPPPPPPPCTSLHDAATVSVFSPELNQFFYKQLGSAGSFMSFSSHNADQ